MRYGFEVLVDGQWSAEAAGQQDDSNYFESREEAEAELPRLAKVLGVSLDEVRIVEIP